MTDSRPPLEVIRRALEWYSNPNLTALDLQWDAGSVAKNALAALATIESAQPQVEKTPMPVCVWHRYNDNIVCTNHGPKTSYGLTPQEVCPFCGKLVMVMDSLIS